MANKLQHVLILGAGLAGPCLALSLARRNIRSTIFEIRAARNESGGSISLGPNGLLVLDRYAGVLDEIKASGYAYHRFGAYTDGGEKIGEIGVGDETKPEGYPALRIMRKTLNKLLLDKGVESGMVDVKWGAKMTKIEEDEKGVTAYFEDGTKAQGDILIGADGIHSKVRTHVLGPLAPTPIFSKSLIVNGFISSSSVTLPPGYTFPSILFTDSGFLMTIPIDSSGEKLAWGITIPSEERTREELAEMERSGEAAGLAKAIFDDVDTEPVRSLLDNADVTKAKVWAPYYIPALPTFHKSRVCLIGDAAHGLPPNGQGSGIAFEDVGILTRLLTSPGAATDYDALFTRFEAIRQPRIEKLRKAEASANAAIKRKTGAWAWWAKKWAFRGYFWWNGGVLKHTKETMYDVDAVDIGQ